MRSKNYKQIYNSSVIKRAKKDFNQEELLKFVRSSNVEPGKAKNKKPEDPNSLYRCFPLAPIVVIAKPLDLCLTNCVQII